MHLSFQEHLAALNIRQELLAHNDGPLTTLVDHFGESWWLEVTLLLMALSDPPLFAPFMDRLVEREAFVRHPALVIQCVDEAFQIDAGPFLKVLRADARSSVEAQYVALQGLKVLKDLHDPRIVGVCQRLKASKHSGVSALALELLAARGFREDVLKAGSVWVHAATGLEFVYVPPGSFLMGSEKGHSDERPVHRVTFARGFWIGKYPVTNAQYGRYMKEKMVKPPEYWENSQFNSPDQPVVAVTWHDAKAYSQWADGMLRLGGKLPPADGDAIILPSEAEWEYAARGPEGREYPWGKAGPTPKLANYDKSKIGRTTPVGQYPKGASWVGALDMAGNVWEWCADAWHDSYVGAPADGSPWRADAIVPEGLNEKEPLKIRVVRGGYWGLDAVCLRSAYRHGGHTMYRVYNRGFRVALSAVPGGSS